MSKTTGYSQLVCDRCGAEEFAAENSPIMQKYKNIRRVDQGDVDVTRYLCASCASAYRKMVAEQDAQFSDFMDMVAATGSEA